MASIQTLSDSDRRTIARWAADCAERVLPLFDGDASATDQVRDAIARTRAYSNGETTAAEQIRLRFAAGKAAQAAKTPAGAAAARAAGQASSVAHMGAHALGAAGYVAKAVSLANPAPSDAVAEEVRWQIEQLTDDDKAILRQLPTLGSDSSGPLGTGLLTQGVVGEVIEQIQNEVAGGRPRT
ncbi:hypothetical protein GOARA_061_00180 [Gordonia araii NBRC 100433]|uniref:Imm-5-like domain-containing protein n=1 Tax=Gordonia araii NBRC 100433 TaxID=1073574 RepID=G7H404_9ACTN|nr:hypothetical protein [Gordonia araii]NNG96356.1 hypothetical protein [Gordonia araii NBRC 100433]GAB10579.1 hypothetical protein GOARA_061_00180 [Gordonia araii NBRC 100433]